MKQRFRARILSKSTGGSSCLECLDWILVEALLRGDWLVWTLQAHVERGEIMVMVKCSVGFHV